MSTTNLRGRVDEHTITDGTSPQPSRPVTLPPPPRPVPPPRPRSAALVAAVAFFVGCVTVVSALIALTTTRGIVLAQDLQVWMALGFLATFALGQTVMGGRSRRRRRAEKDVGQFVAG